MVKVLMYFTKRKEKSFKKKPEMGKTKEKKNL